jgi:hypothetical protein
MLCKAKPGFFQRHPSSLTDHQMINNIYSIPPSHDPVPALLQKIDPRPDETQTYNGEQDEKIGIPGV